MPAAADPSWRAYVQELFDTGRVSECHIGDIEGWVATEKLEGWEAAIPIVRGWMESIGPVRVDELAGRLAGIAGKLLPKGLPGGWLKGGGKSFPSFPSLGFG